MEYLMKCGHIAQARSRDGIPVCAICAGVTPDATIVDRIVTGTDGLEGRKAYCTYGHHGETDSSWDLPFFEYHPNSDEDVYYCGCYGWD